MFVKPQPSKRLTGGVKPNPRKRCTFIFKYTMQVPVVNLYLASKDMPDIFFNNENFPCFQIKTALIGTNAEIFPFCVHHSSTYISVRDLWAGVSVSAMLSITTNTMRTPDRVHDHIWVITRYIRTPLPSFTVGS